jgi:hypothetical protein
MDKTKLGLAAALATIAAPAVAPAQTFADLLAPIPNASARLQAADTHAPAPQLTQTAYDHHHHHAAYVTPRTHHHHHHYYRHYRRVIRHIVRGTTDHHHHHHT